MTDLSRVEKHLTLPDFGKGVEDFFYVLFHVVVLQFVRDVVERPPSAPCYSLAVTKMPHSGPTDELLEEQGIDKEGIKKKVRELLGSVNHF